MEPGKQRPIQSMDEARHWERLFIGEIQAGRDPRRPRIQRKSGDATPTSVGDFLDAYMSRSVKPAGLLSIRSIQSRVAALKEYLGELPLDALEEADEINRFKTESPCLLAVVSGRQFRRKESNRRNRLGRIDIATDPTTERIEIRGATVADLAKLREW
jgi:hypothetical protein